MRLFAVELRVCSFDLVHPLATSTTRHVERPVVLVRVLPQDGPEGWGECDALAEPTYTAEYAEGAATVLAEHLVPKLLAHEELDEDDPAADAVARLAPIRGHRMAKAAIEMAVLDAALRKSGRSLAEHLGAEHDSVPAGATVSIGDPDEVVAAVAQAVDAGYVRVKCKVAPGSDVEPLRAVRAAFPELAVVADANGAYCVEEREHRRTLQVLDELGLAAIEQPLAPADLPGHVELTAMLETPVLLDESVEDEADLAGAIALGALDGLVVKPGRLGGLRAARRAVARCRAAGLHLSLGGMLETGLARAAHLALAATAGFDLPGDLGASERYFVPDLTVPHVLHDGALAVPAGPGLGVRPDPVVLAKATRRVAFGTVGTTSGPLSWTPGS